jgi:hypothetical protein
MDAEDYIALMTKLGVAIDAAIAHWETYLAEYEDHPSYENIIPLDKPDSSTKAKALQYLLQTLPDRYAALVRSYTDLDLEQVQLPDVCGNLLDELQSENHDVDLTAWFKTPLVGKKSFDRIQSVEKEIKDMEAARKQELHRLKANHLMMMEVLSDGELGMEDVERLLDAMEAMGVLIGGVDESCSRDEPVEAEGGGSVGKSGV